MNQLWSCSCCRSCDVDDDGRIVKAVSWELRDLYARRVDETTMLKGGFIFEIQVIDNYKSWFSSVRARLHFPQYWVNLELAVTGPLPFRSIRLFF